MLMKTSIAALVLTTGIIANAPAKADGFFFGFYGDRGGIRLFHDRPNVRFYNPRPYRYMLTRKQIKRSLRHRGFYDFRKIKRKRNDYIVVAKGRRGNLVRLRVDGFTGEIERRRVLYRR